MINEDDERISRALDWCKKRNIGSKQLNLFDRQYKRKKRKEEMNKEAKVEPGALCVTIFTKNIKSS